MNSEHPDGRYERKQRVEGFERQVVEQVIRDHPAHLLPIYVPRLVNNLYFDTYDRSYLADHLAGVPQRKKVRLRWYGALDDPQEPSLEIKSKRGWLIFKRVFPFPPTSLPELLDALRLRRYLHTGPVPEPMRELLALLQPVLINRYRRAYWRTNDQSVRVTVDSNMSFYGPQGPIELPRLEDDAIIVELKYDPRDEARGAEVANRFPFCLQKNSKYVTGALFLSAM